MDKRNPSSRRSYLSASLSSARLVLVVTPILIASPMLLGCGNKPATVSGTVTLNGQPVEGSRELYGTVSFYPTGGGAPAVGIIGSGGSYSVETGSQTGLAPGSYRVAVAVKKIHPPATPEGLTRPERISPVKYSKPEQSGLTAEVEPGSNTFDFALESGAGSK
jgi:hypothetical protein